MPPSPGRAGADNPEDHIDKQAVVFDGHTTVGHFAGEKRFKPLPRVITQHQAGHKASKYSDLTSTLAKRVIVNAP